MSVARRPWRANIALWNLLPVLPAGVILAGMILALARAEGRFDQIWGWIGVVAGGALFAIAAFGQVRIARGRVER